MTPADLVQRTYNFGVAVVRLSQNLPDTVESRRIRGQLTDAATSVSANYRAACRARPRADEFIAKIGVCGEEADEAAQLLKIFTASARTAKRRNTR